MRPDGSGRLELRLRGSTSRWAAYPTGDELRVEFRPITPGQASIDEGRYDRAVREFSALIEAEPREVDGYRGRAEASLLLGRFADAYRDYYARITALITPMHPDATDTIDGHYAARLAAAPRAIPALTGAGFVQWAYFDYGRTIRLLDELLAVRPDDVFGTLYFRGCSAGARRHHPRGAWSRRPLKRAIALAPESADVHYIVADAYTYGSPDPERAFAEASITSTQLDAAIVTRDPRVRPLAFGKEAGPQLSHIERHLELVTTKLLTTGTLAVGTTVSLDLAPGCVYDVPLHAAAGETISVATSSRDFVDTIALAVQDRRHAAHRQRRHERAVRRDRMAGRRLSGGVPVANEFVRGGGHGVFEVIRD